MQSGDHRLSSAGAAGDETDTSRRRVLQAVAGAGVVGVAGVTAGRAQQPAGTAVWQFDTGGAVLSSPTVVGNTVFVGNNAGVVNALDRDDGTRQWQFQTGDDIFSSPTVVDGTVFVGSRDHSFYALDAADGTEQWRFETDDEIGGSPTVVDGTVFVGSLDGRLYALDAADGTEQWRFETGAKVWSSPVVSDMTHEGTVERRLFIGSTDNSLYALEPATGERHWEFETGDSVWSVPTVFDDTVFVGSFDTNVYAVDAASGDQRWRFETGDIVRSSPTVVAEGLDEPTLWVGSYDGSVYALAAATGEKRWEFDTSTERLGSFVVSSPTVVGESEPVVYVGGRRFVRENSDVRERPSHVYALDAATGTERWRFETDSWVVSSPTVVDGTVFVGGWDGRVYALAAGRDGSGRGSRARLGTLGHHEEWAHATSTAETTPGGPATNASGNETDSTDGSGPGFGVASACVGGAGYLLWRLRAGNR